MAVAVEVAHRSPLAGRWYPAGRDALESLLSEQIAKSARRVGPFTRRGGLGFIAPHAGPQYSGAVAASVYRHVAETEAQRVILLGFSHRRALGGVAIAGVESYETPLGAAAVDRAAAERLAGQSPFWLAEEAEVCDHSVEIHLPFLQMMVPGAQVLPLYVGRLGDRERRQAAGALRGLLDGRTVLIASSDLTHYGREFGYLPFAADDQAPERLRELDMGALRAAGSLEAGVFRRELERTGATVCGAGPIELLIETLSGLGGEVFEETLDYETSGEITGDWSHSVSYGAAGFFPASAFWLDEDGQRSLLESARFTLDSYRSTGEQRLRPAAAGAALMQRGRAFVTLYSGREIRGCVGCFERPLPLAECVPKLAIAAHEDQRFGPTRPEERLIIEVHILTPPRRIQSASQIRIGGHGLFLDAGGRKGLLLSSVAERHGLTPREFLREVARKIEQALELNPPADIAAFLKEMANRHRHNMEWARAEAIKAFDE